MRCAESKVDLPEHAGVPRLAELALPHSGDFEAPTRECESLAELSEIDQDPRQPCPGVAVKVKAHHILGGQFPVESTHGGTIGGHGLRELPTDGIGGPQEEIRRGREHWITELRGNLQGSATGRDRLLVGSHDSEDSTLVAQDTPQATTLAQLFGEHLCLSEAIEAAAVARESVER